MHTIFSNGKFHFGILLIILLFSFQQISFAQFANSPLDPTTKTKFEDPMLVVKDAGLRYDVTGLTDKITVKMAETTQYLGIKIGGNPYSTKVWGYQFPGLPPTYPGATMVAKENERVMIRWENELPGHFLPVDRTMHMAHPNDIHTLDEIKAWYDADNVPTVAHLHGGHTESASDGLPEAWFTQGFAEKGNYFVKKNYRYDNTQESATLWYHDHALGITRLNVYAGLAGFYLLRDDNEENLVNTGVLPGGDYEIEIVIQDKMFDTNGELFWPAFPGEEPYNEFIETPLPTDVFPDGGPTALAEFFGDYILVNAMTWPKLDVEPRKYRFRLLNGSDSRFYVLEFRDTEGEAYGGATGSSFLQIGTDDGLLPEPVPLTQLLIAPGERMDLVVDFTGLSGSSIYLRNFGPDEPYGGGEPDVDFDAADPNTTGQIMRFDVSGTAPTTDATVTLGTTLRAPIVPLVPDGETRNLVLFEGMDNYERLMPMLGTLADGSLTWNDPITENPMKNDVEMWEVYNATGDAHPVHLHLVKFQIVNREPFTTVDGNGVPLPEPEVTAKDQLLHNGEYGTGFILNEEDIELSGDVRDPEDNEKGWKDTAVMLPGEVTRVIAKFDRNGRYVWHCHILSHEDHEMMRPFQVGPIRKAKESSDEFASVTEFSLDQNYPNPFNPSTTINFTVPQNSQVTLKIYDVLGKEVSTLINQVVPAGNHEVNFDATGLPSGVYFYNLTAGNFVENKKMMLMK
jgi:spore coat protein A